MAISFIHGWPPKYLGLSTDVKPTGKSEVLLESEFIETDTGRIFVFTGETWIEAPHLHPGHNYLYNTVTMEWEAATTVGTVAVSNFTTLDPTSAYKITNLDTSGATMYFGFVDAGGAWYILSLSGTDGLYLKGSSGYAAAWAARVGAGYAQFDAVF